MRFSVKMSSQYKNVRFQRKSVISRYYNTLERQVVEQDVDSVKASLKLLTKNFNELELAHYQYVDALAAEPAGDEATLSQADQWFKDTLREYKDKVKTVHEWLTENGVDDSFSVPTSNETAVADTSLSATFPDELAARLSLPPQVVPTFDGRDVREYKSFISTFDQVIGRAITDPQEKLTRLAGYLKGEALHSIRASVLKGGSAGYTEAYEILKSRYGNIFALSEKMIEDLRSGKPVHKPADLLSLADDLVAAEQILKGSNAYVRVNQPEFMRQVVSRCKPYIKEKWRRFGLRKNEDNDALPTFTEFVKFLSKYAKEACNPVFGEEVFKNSSSSSAGGRVYHANVSPSSPDVKAGFTCPKCKGNHRVYDCSAFKSLSLSEKRVLVQSSRLCFRCLKFGHFARECRGNTKCDVAGCTRRHHSLLHGDSPSNGQSSGNSHGNAHVSRVQVCQALSTVEDVIQLPLVNVRINDAETIVALLDPGSTCTLISSRLSKKLKLKGKTVPFTLQTVHGRKEFESQLVTFELESLSKGYKHVVQNACVVSDIPAMAPRQTVEHRDFEHLANLDVGTIAAGAKADLILGQDNADVLVPLEIRSGPVGGNMPYAVLTRLGWVLNGKFGQSACEPGQVYGMCNVVTVEESVCDKRNMWSLNEVETNPVAPSRAYNSAGERVLDVPGDVHMSPEAPRNIENLMNKTYMADPAGAGDTLSPGGPCEVNTGVISDSLPPESLSVSQAGVCYVDVECQKGILVSECVGSSLRAEIGCALVAMMLLLTMVMVCVSGSLLFGLQVSDGMVGPEGRSSRLVHVLTPEDLLEVALLVSAFLFIFQPAQFIRLLYLYFCGLCSCVAFAGLLAYMCCSGATSVAQRSFHGLLDQGFTPLESREGID